MYNPDFKNGLQFWSLLVLRVGIGWYFLYEGIVKLIDENWTSYAYLKNSYGPLSKVWMKWADQPDLIAILDFLNTWGLICIGLGLILGFLSRVASVAGVILLLLYYLSYPPSIEASSFQLTGDHVLWIDKNLIFMMILVVLYAFPTNRIIGIDRLLFKKNN